MTKDDLKKYLSNADEIKRLDERIQTLNNQLYRCNSTIITDMPKGGVSAYIKEKLIDEKQKLIEQYLSMQQESHLEMLKIENAILKLQDERYKTLLSLRYLDGRTWEYIAENMGYELRNIYYLHGQALSCLKSLHSIAL